MKTASVESSFFNIIQAPNMKWIGVQLITAATKQ